MGASEVHEQSRNGNAAQSAVGTFLKTQQGYGQRKKKLLLQAYRQTAFERYKDKFGTIQK